ncbi:MAG: hypothetical protein LBH84_06350 [Prevotellaceae bacterium]|jgi:hypothetical protein|nr:hypothetical protein [Prevotellaceae bacterium]
MKKCILLFGLFAGLTASLPAQNVATSVSYRNGIFTTTVTVPVSAPHSAASQVIDRFIHQYKNEVDLLFGWALKEVNLQGEKDGFMIFNILSHSLSGNVVEGAMDMEAVALGKRYKSVTYKVHLDKVIDTPDTLEILYKLYDCQDVIQNVDARLKFTLQNRRTVQLSLVADVKLTSFYNTMVSRAAYDKNMTWRFAKFVENMAKAAQNPQ